MDMDSEMAEEKHELGQQQFKAKNYVSALKYFSHAIFLCPHEAEYFDSRAACFMIFSNYNKALSDARTAVQLDVTFENAYVRIAKCCVAKGDISGAEQAIKKIQALNAESNAAKTEKQNVAKLNDLERKIQKYYASKDYSSVSYYTHLAIKLAPACYKYQLMRAESLAILGRCDEAFKIAVKVLNEDTISAEAVYVRGLCYYYSDNLQKSSKHFEWALQLDASHTKARDMCDKSHTLKHLKEYANSFLRSGLFHLLQTACTQALTIDKTNKATNIQFLYYRAEISFRFGQLSDAVNDCSQILQMDNKHWKALVLRASCFYDMGQFQRCCDDCDTARQMQTIPQVDKLLSLAKAALKQNDYYAILGITRNASPKEIKKAYRQKAMAHHTDRHVNKSSEEQKKHENKFKEVGEAYRVLSDPTKKQSYDSGLGQKTIETEEFHFHPHSMFSHFNGLSEESSFF